MLWRDQLWTRPGFVTVQGPRPPRLTPLLHPQEETGGPDGPGQTGGHALSPCQMTGPVQHLGGFVPLGHDPSREQRESVAQRQERAGVPLCKTAS